MRSSILLCLCFLLSSAGQAQDQRLDVRVGGGKTLLTAWSETVITAEAELNYTLNRFFTLAGGIGIADTEARAFSPAISFFRSDVGLFFSPFTNRRRHDFRVGGGMSYLGIASPTRAQIASINDEIFYAHYTYGKDRGIGYAVVVDHTYSLTPRLLVGLRVAARGYTTYDNNVDALLRVGLRL